MTDTTKRPLETIKNEYMTACAQLGEARYNIEAFTSRSNDLLTKVDGLIQELNAAKEVKSE